MNLAGYFRVLVLTLLLAQVTGKLYLVYHGQQIVIETRDKQIGGPNVKGAIKLATGDEGGIDLLKLDQLKIDEIFRIHPSLIQELTSSQRLGLLDQLRGLKGSNQAQKARVRLLRDALLYSVANFHPTDLGESNIDAVNKYVNDILKIHPLTVIINKDFEFSQENLRRLFNVPLQSSRADGDADDSLIDALFNARACSTLYSNLASSPLPNQLIANNRIAIFMASYPFFNRGNKLEKSRYSGAERRRLSADYQITVANKVSTKRLAAGKNTIQNAPTEKAKKSNETSKTDKELTNSTDGEKTSEKDQEPEDEKEDNQPTKDYKEIKFDSLSDSEESSDGQSGKDQVRSPNDDDNDFDKDEYGDDDDNNDDDNDDDGDNNDGDNNDDNDDGDNNDDNDDGDNNDDNDDGDNDDDNNDDDGDGDDDQDEADSEESKTPTTVTLPDLPQELVEEEIDGSNLDNIIHQLPCNPFIPHNMPHSKRTVQWQEPIIERFESDRLDVDKAGKPHRQRQRGTRTKSDWVQGINSRTKESEGNSRRFESRHPKDSDTEANSTDSEDFERQAHQAASIARRILRKEKRKLKKIETLRTYIDRRERHLHGLKKDLRRKTDKWNRNHDRYASNFGRLIDFDQESGDSEERGSREGVESRNQYEFSKGSDEESDSDDSSNDNEKMPSKVLRRGFDPLNLRRSTTSRRKRSEERGKTRRVGKWKSVRKERRSSRS